MTTLCPHCGYDLRADTPVSSGDISIDPRGIVTWRGKEVRLGYAKITVTLTLLKAKGRLVSAEVIAERIGYEGDDPRNIVSVHICLLRKLLPGVPIEIARGQGWRWAA